MEPKITSLVVRVIRESSGREVALAYEDALISTGYLDSMTMVSLIIELQAEFGVQFDVSDMSVENFESVRAISKLVQSRI
jgi:acyl carrier protein